MAKCGHHYCRCIRAAELSSMGRTDLAIEIHQAKATVTCQRQSEIDKPEWDNVCSGCGQRKRSCLCAPMDDM